MNHVYPEDDRLYLDYLRISCGMKPALPRAVLFARWYGPDSMEALAESEWSPVFERLMRNRLIIGSLRYGRIGSKGKPRYDRIGSIQRRLDKYRDTGNQEHLVDIANECLLEFAEPCRPGGVHWESIDDGEHTNVLQES